MGLFQRPEKDKIMSVKIRLSRHGTKKKPHYRIVVTDSRSPRDGKFIEQVGTYDPKAASGIRLNREKMDAWIKRGAKPSQTVSELMKKAQSTT
jgi:small subunit ribosomal protein S16